MPQAIREIEKARIALARLQDAICALSDAMGRAAYRGGSVQDVRDSDRAVREEMDIVHATAIGAWNVLNAIEQRKGRP